MENDIRNEEIKNIIEKSVDKSVNRAFRKYDRTTWIFHTGISSIAVILVLVIALSGSAFWLYSKKDTVVQAAAPVEGHDLTLEDNGIFGYTAADFKEPILGESVRQKLLIVDEQEAYDETTITDTGLFNWEVFHKEQVLTFHGIGQYTVDLSEITSEDISLNEDTYELTIRIPHAALHKVIPDPSKTEVGDSSNGWLAFGSIKLDQEQQKEFEAEAQEKLQEKLGMPECLEEADRFAKLTAYEIYQPIVKAVSPAYKVVIEFK